VTTLPNCVPHSTRRVEFIWGTAISLDVRDRVDPVVLDEVVAWFHRVDDLFSTWREDSEISRLARRELRLDEVSSEVRMVLDLCDEVTHESRGAFDVTFAADPRVAPQPGYGPIDPSGLVKGWALEHAAALLSDRGVANFSINAGGDVITRGRPAPGALWRVGIQHPTERHAVAAIIAGTDLAVATSGRYERGDHIIDPRTGSAATDLSAVTVVGRDLAIADGYATAALVLGSDGTHWLAGQPDIEAMVINNDGTVTLTEGFDQLRSAAQAKTSP
jgi:thiamine biosynthesis lipoprotein